MDKKQDNIYQKAFWEICEKHPLFFNRELLIKLGIPKKEIITKLKEYLFRIREERRREQRHRNDFVVTGLFNLEIKIIEDIQELETELQEEECDDLIKAALMEIGDRDLL